MKFFKKPVVIIALAILAAVLGLIIYFSGSKKSTPELVETKIGTIIQEVSVTGNVKPVSNVDLAFEKSGRIVSVFKDVGNYVNEGDILVREDNSELGSQLEKARADLETQKAEIEKSKVTLGNYYSSVSDVLNDSYTKADDAVRKQVDVYFTDGETNTPKLSFTTTDSQAQTDAQNGRLTSRAELNAWKQELGQINADTSYADLTSALAKSRDHLSAIRNFLTNAMVALDKAYGLTSSTLDSYKANTITARTSINTALTSITSQKQSIDSQLATIASEEAEVKSYEAGTKNIEAQISKTILYAPISGIVTKQDAKAGQIASAGTVLVSVLSSVYEIEAFIPEVDIAKIKIGDSSRLTLDAYGKDVSFEAKVTAIDPGETMVEGVATYKTTLRFVSNDKPVKSGMTANLDILASKKDNVLIIPQRAVSAKDGGKFVKVYDPSVKDAGLREVKVVTGVRGSDGNVEILEGLKAGDQVIISLD